MSFTSKSECLDTCRGSYAQQTHIEKAKTEGAVNTCNTSTSIWPGDNGSDVEITTYTGCFLGQLGPKDNNNEEDI